jgi:O-antigen/teichoic acid export membrane protein
MDGGSRARRVLTNSAVLAVSKILERASGFVVGVLIANRLGAEGLGVYAAAWALYGVIAVAGSAGTTEYLVREIGRDRSCTASYTVHLSILALVFAGILMGATQLVARHVGYSRELETSISIMLLAILPKVVNAIQEGVFVAYGKVAYQTLTRFWSATFYVVLSAWMLANGAGVSSLVQSFVALEYAVAVAYFILINRNIVRLRPAFRPVLARRLVHELRAFVASSMLAALFARPEVVLLSVMVSEQQVGFYSAAIRVIELPLTLFEVLMVNVFPMMAETFKSAEDRFAAWQTAAVRVMLASSLLVAACCFALADQIVEILYGDGFGQAAAVLRVLGVTVVFFSLIAVFWRSLVARGRQGVNVSLQFISVVVRLSSGVLLIAPYAAIGAAISSGLSSLVHVSLLIRAAARSGAPEAVLRLAWRFALAAGVAGLVMWVLRERIPVPAALTVGSMVYVVLLAAVGAINRDDLAMLRRGRPSRQRHGADSSDSGGHGSQSEPQPDSARDTSGTTL